MARNRKEKTKSSPPPLPETPEQLQISEEEQWRLVNDSGILSQKVPRSPESELEVEDDTPLADEIFNAVILIIPFSFLLLMMEMCVYFFDAFASFLQTPQHKFDPFSVRPTTNFPSNGRQNAAQRPKYVFYFGLWMQNSLHPR
jgi:hypothetical protein